MAERRRASYSDKSERENCPYQGNIDGMKEAVSLGIPKETASYFFLIEKNATLAPNGSE
ncbi:hypothetical protein MNQ98_23100 [Paenibacillus sp. N3/727]|uniref:hypothetical protein n=1 Tax=Paenibacillus sp. N3/727 TaxID=2925845 RepID=UPI001F53D0AE|nr:hypothetical protein [Paenibacillus sp. N3/727]UNK17337.1 hypothetical protein MNQ98_23100 [Paenibacillus sp. N3/727]